jgi:hypothetical protein
MRRAKLALSLMIMVPSWALLGGFARLDAERPTNVLPGIAVGAIVGVFFGLVFGGASGRWLDFVYGLQVENEDGE